MCKRTKGVEMPYKKCWFANTQDLKERFVCQNHKACKNAFQIWFGLKRYYRLSNNHECVASILG